MRLATEIITKLIYEQVLAGPAWPHPWDHYPFMTAGKYVWLRYQELDSVQRKQVRCAVVQVMRKLGQHSLAVEMENS